VGEEESSHHTDLIQRALESGQPVSSGQDDPAVRSRDGRAIFLASSAAPLLNRDGAVMGAVVAFRDVSAEREFDQLQSDFISLVSHELRSPLASISASVELMMESPADAQVAQEMLPIVHAQSQNLIQLVEDILDISQIDAGQVKVREEPVTLLPTLRRLAAEFQRETDQHHLFVKAQEPIPFVMADRSKVEMVVSNLLKNAIKYSPSGGRIMIEVIDTDNGQVVVNIIDEGIGIPEEHQEKVFDRFYRVDTGDDRKIYGHGLGLHISQRLIEMQGGEIWLRSKVGQGSCFSFSLPAVQKTEMMALEKEQQA
jgi:signal transduction histidine kinase